VNARRLERKMLILLLLDFGTLSASR